MEHRVDFLCIRPNTIHTDNMAENLQLATAETTLEPGAKGAPGGTHSTRCVSVRDVPKMRWKK